MPETAPALVLASASPRRSQLLSQIGVVHRVLSADIDERRQSGESAADCVLRLARAKAAAVAARLGDPAIAVLGADTEVILDGELLGKPRDRAHGLAMLGRLSGRAHEVLSGVALAHGGRVLARLSRTRVQFRALSAAECAAYWDGGEPRDKAGGYAIQGGAAIFVESLQGSYSGVMGLPLFETAELLAAAEVPIWQASAPHE